MARLDRLSKMLTPDNVELLACRLREEQIEQRVESWTATRADFVVLLAPDLDEFRIELMDEAVKDRSRRLQHGTSSDEWRVPFLAGQVVGHALGTVEHEGAYRNLERLAAEPAADWRLSEEAQYEDPWDSRWFQANLVLAALGDDRGHALHRAALPAITEACEGWAEGRADLEAKIAAGTAERLDFMFWTEPDLDDRRQRIFQVATERRKAREAGVPLELETVYDYAADLVSYPPEEDVPEGHLELLVTARDHTPPPGTPAQEEWAEANELHWVVVLRLRDLRTELAKAMQE